MSCEGDLDDLGNLTRSAYTSYFMKTIHYVSLEVLQPVARLSVPVRLYYLLNSQPVARSTALAQLTAGSP